MFNCTVSFCDYKFMRYILFLRGLNCIHGSKTEVDLSRAVAHDGKTISAQN